MASLIACSIMAGLLSAQNPQLSLTPQPVQHSTFPTNIAQIFPQRVEHSNTSEFSHGYCRVNISWGGGEPRVWSGEMRMTDGEMRHLTLLGSEPDVPGSIWIEESGLGIRSRSAKSFSGVHVTLDCHPEAHLQVNLFDQDKKTEFKFVWPVIELLNGAVQHVIDESGNCIRIERVPGDELSIRMVRETTIFQPGEPVQFEVLLRFLNIQKDKKLFLNVSLYRSRSNDRVLETEWPVIGDEIPATIPVVPVSFAMPQTEGVFDIVLTLHKKNDRFSLIGGSKDIIFAQRTFQCLVLSPQPVAVTNGGKIQADYRGVLVERIDPSNPNWWRRFVKSPMIPRILPGGSTTHAPTVQQYEQFHVPEPDRSTLDSVRDRVSQLSPGQLLNRPQERPLWQENFGSGHVVPYQSTKYNTQGLVEMLPSGDETLMPWEAYPIPINEPDKPHFLEIDYLSGIEQTLGISIVEPTVSGGLFPGTVDSGLHIGREIVSDNHATGRTMQHRILFWPKSKTPIVLLTNPSTNQSAVYGSIRIYRAPDAFPQSLPQSTDPNTVTLNRNQRLFATYLHRPEFCENFSATRVPGHLPHVGVSDWETFRQGIDRMVQYMRMAGYGGLMISVASDGSCLYPSRLIAPTPRYDTGVFLANGEDPVRKDVLQALATAFDRENMTLIPAIDFCMPLPTVEELIRRNAQTNTTPSPGESGMTWVGPYGNLLVDLYTSQNQSGRAPYYHLLNPNVQNAMLDVVRELVARSALHPSFGGIAVQLSPEGYAMLPEEFWGLDDDTIARFSRDTRIVVPGQGPERFTERAEFLRAHCHKQWLQWRADQVTAFYRRMAEIVVGAKPDAKLYLAGAKLFDSPLSQRTFSPSLTQPGNVANVLALHGFDLMAYRDNPNIVFMRPEKIMADNNLAAVATNLELSHTKDTAKVFQQLVGSSNPVAGLFYHQPIEHTLPSFDAKSPFQPAHSRLTTTAVPAGDQNRKRFVRHLADHDVAVFFDGSVTLPFGEEDALREMAMQFQQLPRVPFEKYDTGKTTTQPVTFRYANTESGTFCYLVNKAAFSVPVRVFFDTGPGSRVVPLAVLRDGGNARIASGGLEWSQTLRPYDFVAFAVSDANAKPNQVEINLPANITGANGQLEKQFRQFDARIRFLRDGLEWDRLPNGNFEMTPALWQQFLNEQRQLAQATAADKAATTANSPYSRPRPFSAIALPSIGHLFAGRNGNGATNTDAMPNNNGTGDDTLLHRDHEAVIPGWFVEGDATFRTAVESRPCREGSHCLHLSAQQGGGRVTSMPFDAPRTGRLFVSLWVGVAQDATQLLFRLVIRGQHQNRPFVRSATISPDIWNTIARTPPTDGIRWHSIIVPFRDLPLSGLDSLSVSLELFGNASVWVDDLRLSHLALTDAERTSFAHMSSLVNWRMSDGCVSDALDILEGYWPQLLAECMPNIDELLAQQAVANPPPPVTPPVDADAPKTSEEPKKSTLTGWIKGLKFW